MNSTTTTTAQDQSIVRSIAIAVEPTASVYVRLQPDNPLADTAEDLGLRWRRLAANLAAQGADEATLTTLGNQIVRRPAFPAQYAIFASGGSVLFDRSLPGATGVDVARFGVPANVVPLLAYHQRHPAYVMVVTDRTGADMTSVRRGAVTGSTITVVGPDDEIERNAPGGWAQARYQRRAEDSWQHNAGAVAREVTNALRQVDARLLLVAGDVRAVQLMRDQLPAGVRQLAVIRQLPGGRRPDNSDAVREAAIATAVADFATQETDELMDRFDAERGLGGRSVEGVATTLSALAHRRVHTLLVVDDPDDERLAWFGPDTLCAEAPSEPGQATSWEASGRLNDVAVRAAFLTDADIHVVPAAQIRALSGRIGALCRFVQTTA